MTKDQALELSAELAKLGVRGRPDEHAKAGDRYDTHVVVILDTRDTVWYSDSEGWTWGPHFEHTVYANATPARVAERIVLTRTECNMCKQILDRLR